MLPRVAQWRPCRLKAGPLKDADEWLERYRRFWEESFDRLDEYLGEIQKHQKKHSRETLQKKEGKNDRRK